MLMSTVRSTELWSSHKPNAAAIETKPRSDKRMKRDSVP